jgi:hypothetical protein
MRKHLVALLIVAIASVSLFAPFTVSVSPTTHTPEITPTVAYAQENGDIKFGCGIGPWGDVRQCLPMIVYYGLAAPTAWFASIVANLLDFFIFYSLRGETYKSFDFVEEGWTITRDISNIFFIFSLLMIAISIILGVSFVGNPKKLLINVIVVALLINFSLFFTGVIIDASNLLAKSFYNNINVTTASGEEFTEPALSALVTDSRDNPKSLTVAVLSKLQVQNLLGEEQNIRDLGSVPNQIVFLLMLTVINVILIYVFFVVTWLFLARVITLIMAIVLSPFAFITLALPMGAKIPKLGFKSWINTVLSVSFMAPVFLFFMFLILKFVNNQSFVVLTPSSEGFLMTFLQILIPFALVMALIFAAKKVTVDMSGELAKGVVKAGTSITQLGAGIALGAATGGAALAATKTLGAAGAATARAGRTLESSRGKSWIGNLARRGVGQGLRTAGERAARGSFDWRNTQTGQNISRRLGISSAPLFNTGKRTGGFRQQQADFQRKAQERAEALQLQDDDKLLGELRKANANLTAIETNVSDDLNKAKKDEEKVREEHKVTLRDFNAKKNNLTDATSARDTAAADVKNAQETLANQNLSPAEKAAAQQTLQGARARQSVAQTDYEKAYDQYSKAKIARDKGEEKVQDYKDAVSGVKEAVNLEFNMSLKEAEKQRDDAQRAVNYENYRRRRTAADQVRDLSWSNVLRNTSGAVGGVTAGGVATAAILSGAPIVLAGAGAAGVGYAATKLADALGKKLEGVSGLRDRTSDRIIQGIKKGTKATQKQTNVIQTNAQRQRDNQQKSRGNQNQSS